MIGRPGGNRVAKRGWIVILASIPTNNGRGAALRFARGARGNVGGLSVLNSSNRRPLRGGYWVVYSGPYSTLAAVSRRAGGIHAAGYGIGLHPRADHVPVRRLKTCLRAEEGMTLIELLIAMVVMSIGIAALVAGFSSGIVSIDRARTTSTAGTLADQQMELYRQASFTSLPTTLQPPTTPTGPDGQHLLDAGRRGLDVRGRHVFPGPPASCSGTPASRPVKVLTITVRDGSASAKLLFTETATFDSSTG